MAKFFTSPADLAQWVKTTSSDATEAATRILNIIESDKHKQDIFESCRRIFAGTEGAAGILHDILSQYEITEKQVTAVAEKMNKVYAANELYKNKAVTAEVRDRMVKEAQIMRQPGQYDMPLRICPKLPKQSAGQGLISTYNCRHYCLDSIVFDDNPLRVVCAEALWRRHVMDKFSREWQDPKTGDLVGGYINQRFYVFPDAGTPANPDVDRFHGNNMRLAPAERTRQPRPHEYSTERRLQEAREAGSTKSITLDPLNDATTEHVDPKAVTKKADSAKAVIEAADRQSMIRLASDNSVSKGDEDIYAVYSKSIDLHNSRVSEHDAALKMRDEFGMSLGQVVKIQSLALRKMASHQADMYVVSQVIPSEGIADGGESYTKDEMDLIDVENYGRSLPSDLRSKIIALDDSGLSQLEGAFDISASDPSQGRADRIKNALVAIEDFVRDHGMDSADEISEAIDKISGVQPEQNPVWGTTVQPDASMASEKPVVAEDIHEGAIDTGLEDKRPDPVKTCPRCSNTAGIKWAFGSDSTAAKT